MIRYALLRTVLDPLLAVTTDAGLARLEFLEKAYTGHTRAHEIGHQLLAADGESLDEAMGIVEDESVFEDLRRHLAAYFTGDREEFAFPLDLRGTAFQMKVWQRLRTIPYGRLRTYKQIAREIGAPRATRAVGQAAGMNPLPLVVPCHRVIGSDGALVGYAGGLPVKARLLQLEGHTLGKSFRLAPAQLF